MQSFSASKGDGIADLERQLVLWMKPAVNTEGAATDSDTAVKHEQSVSHTGQISPSED